MSAWPSALPSALFVESFKEAPPDLIIRTEMEQGPDKLRRWGTAGVRSLSGIQVLTAAQVAALDTFYVTTLVGGAASFTWTHPRTSAAITLRFVERPVWEALGSGSYKVSLDLEILP